MCNPLNAILEKLSMLYDPKYGFREKRSTEHFILEIIYQTQTNMDRKLYTRVKLIDFQKAFDTVHPSINLKKINHNVVGGIVKDWFSSYLTDWEQITVISLWTYLRKRQ